MTARKPRFKVQRRNDGSADDLRRFGNTRWTPVWDDNRRLGFTLTQDEANALYWEMSGLYPEQVYRITERR